MTNLWCIGNAKHLFRSKEECSVKPMRAILPGVLAGAMLLVLTACGGGDAESSTPPESSSPASEMPLDSVPPTETVPVEETGEPDTDGTDTAEQETATTAGSTASAAPSSTVASTKSSETTSTVTAAGASGSGSASTTVTAQQDQTVSTAAGTQTAAATATPSPSPTAAATPTPTAAATPTPTPVVNTVYKDGTYTGTGDGYNGKITVSVTIASDKITSIKVTKHSDDSPYIDDAKGVISKMISAQSANVSAVSGATFSSEGIIEAVTNALKSAKN